MKKLVALAAVVMSVLAFSGKAMAAAASSTVNVSATVNSKCVVQTAPTDMLFGAIDPSTFTDTTLSSIVTFRCTKNTSYTVFTDLVNNVTTTPLAKNMASGANNLPYTLSSATAQGASGTGLGAGQDKTYTIGAQLKAVDVQAAVPAAYTGSFTLDITY